MAILNLFFGAGGLSEGFWRNDMDFVGHIESDNYACETLKTRMSYWILKKNKLSVYHDYLIKKISKNELWKISKVSNSNEIINKPIGDATLNSMIKTIRQNMENNNIKMVDIIIGGPPCQAYSLIGRARMKEKVKNDPRNHLYIYYVKFLKEFRPKIFIFENVPGLLNAGGGEYFKKLKKAIENINYHMEFKELVATNFGVLQNRKRIIIIGWNKDYYTDYEYPKFLPDKFENPSVSSCLDDLPKLKSGNKIEGMGKYVGVANKYLIWSKIREKNFNILTQHETRSHNERDKEIYRIAINKWFNDKQRLRYDELAKDRPDLITHKNIKTFTNRFNVVKPDEEYCHTVLAHIAMDGHYYIHPDNEQNRSISIREAARLQSFPDDYYFEGPRTAIFRQIGNAVPLLMAEKIGNTIIKILFIKNNKNECSSIIENA